MDKREMILCALNHEENAIPLWPMGFENIETARRLIGKENVPDDIFPETEYKKGAAEDKNRQIKLKYAEMTDSSVIGVGKGGSFAFGHGGPGEFMEKIMEQGENYRLTVYETGVKKEVRINPHFFRYYDHPALTRDTFEKMCFPVAGDSSRYEGIRNEAEFLKSNGYFTYANINGFFSGLHYFLCPYDELLVLLLTEPDFVRAMLKKLGEFNMTAAENLLKCGVDCITFCDDLGSGNSLLFSPELYEEFFFPWHKELAGLCHSYGAYAHMHSHGNINKIISRIVNTGIDMINPCDPYENMDLKSLKEAYGERITFVGGIDKFFFEWDETRMSAEFERVIHEGSKGGGYIFMDSSGGIPENVSQKKYDFFMKISKEFRKGNLHTCN